MSDCNLPTVPEGSVILRSCEIVQFLDPSGEECIIVKWISDGGSGNVIAEFGLLEYAKQELAMARLSECHHADIEDDA